MTTPNRIIKRDEGKHTVEIHTHLNEGTIFRQLHDNFDTHKDIFIPPPINIIGQVINETRIPSEEHLDYPYVEGVNFTVLRRKEQ